MNIEDKLVVVTGAGSGIGRSLAQSFSDHGARRVVCTDLNADSAVEIAALIGEKATGEGLDVTDEAGRCRYICL
jgi:NAD(P)-dependent dehydrogenase (short-subunit alcohol dehydrogenase family)